MRSGTRSPIWAICVPKNSHFFVGIGEEWHTISNLGNCVPKNSHFILGIDEDWHTIPDLGNLCAMNFSFFSSKISGGRAGLAHKTRI